jgi:putative glycosyltransferase (TIGR04372 family)
MEKSFLAQARYAFWTEIQVRTLVFRNIFRKRGVLWVVRGLFKHFALLGLWIILFPFSLVLHIVGVRRLTVRVEHIGHLAGEIDCFLKERRLARLPQRIYVIVAPPNRVANEHLLRYWKPYFNVVTDSGLGLMLEAMSRWLVLKQDINKYMGSKHWTQCIYEINATWGDRPPVVSLSAEDEEWGREAIEKLGVPRDSWFVCVHMREGKFLPHNELIQQHRNADIITTYSAMQEIVGRGGWCVRIGDRSMTPLPSMPGVIDYACHPLKSPRLDIILSAKSRFFLGCNSGLALVSATFGVPCALTNMLPVSTLAARKVDISIPKLLRLDTASRYLTFREIMSSPTSRFFFSYQYDRAGIRILDNTGDEVRDLVVEMLNRMDGTFVDTEEDRDLQRRYMALFKPGHYAYGAASRIGAAFLRKYRHLLD